MIKLNNGASFEKNSTMFLKDDFKPIAMGLKSSFKNMVLFFSKEAPLFNLINLGLP